MVWLFSGGRSSVLSLIYLYIVIIKPNCIVKFWNWIVELVNLITKRGNIRETSLAGNTQATSFEQSYYSQIDIIKPFITGTVITAIILVPLSIALEINHRLGTIVGIVGQILILLIVGIILTHYETNDSQKILNSLKGWITNTTKNIRYFKWLGKAKAITLIVLTIGFWFTIYSLCIQLVTQ